MEDLSMEVVILAGGEGLSASPYNQIFPKPMLPVGQSPILELALKQLKKHGFRHFHIVVSQHSGQLIRTYFGKGEALGVDIVYHFEEIPRGTAGALGFLTDHIKSTFLLMNADILTVLDFPDLVNYHKKEEAILTIASYNQGVYLDFGYIELEGDLVVGYKEKPTLESLISMGVYVMEPGVFEFIPTDGLFHIPHLVDLLIEKGKKVMAYEHSEYWLDIGLPKDYAKANKDFEEIKQYFSL